MSRATVLQDIADMLPTVFGPSPSSVRVC